MNTAERIAKVLFGGGGRDVTRRAVTELVPDDVLQEFGLGRRTSNAGGALFLLGTGIALGAAGYYVFGPQGRPVRARMLAWLQTLRADAKAAATDMLSESPSDGVSKQTHAEAVPVNHS